jgi:hypothetical protein
MHRRHRARRLPAYFCGMTLDLTDKEQLAIAAKPPASELGYRVWAIRVSRAWTTLARRPLLHRSNGPTTTKS